MGCSKCSSNIADVEIVGQAHNAPDAIILISESKPDVVILDIRLPGLSGIDVLKISGRRNCQSGSSC
jgi:YesN/AraC family two-component response regulator